MDRAPQEFRMDEVRQLVESFFKGITENQWKLLVVGSPDNVTQIQLAELILSIIESVTKTLLAAITKTGKPEAKTRVLDTLDDMLPNSFSQALGIPNQDDNGSLKSLSEMIRTEVTENIDSALSTRLPYVQPILNPRIVPPSRVNNMVSSASEVFKRFAAMLKRFFCPPKSRKQEGNQLETVDIYQLSQRFVPTETPEDAGELEYQEDTVEAEYQEEPGELEIQEDSGETEILEYTSEDTFIRRASESLQEQIRGELRKLVLPILDNSEFEYETLQAEASQELQSLSMQIANSIYTGERKNLSLIRGRIRIKDFLARCLSKSLICRLSEKIKRAHPQHTQDASRESLDSLLAVVYSWLQTDVCRNQEAEKEDSLVSWFNISSNKALIFAKQLSDLIYRYVLADLSESTSVGMLGVPEAHDEMFADILGKVWVFVVLMNWWMNSQGQIISERVKMPLMAPLTVSGSSERDAALRMEKNRCCVNFFVEKIVHNVFMDVRIMPNKKYGIVNDLFENVWAAVQGADLYITQEAFKGLGKKIDRVLYRRWGTPELVLFAITSKDPLIEECIISIIKDQLMKPPKKPSSFRRFFSRTKSSPRP